MTTIAERVAAGAAFLDEHEPGWDQRIDLGRLDIAAGCSCILGQLHGDYGVGLSDSGVIDVDVPGYHLPEEAYGFVWIGIDSEITEIRDLTAEWKRLIAARQAAS